MKKVELSWSEGDTDVIILVDDDPLKILTYEFDSDAVHDFCIAGQLYYRSKSGLSGAGWVPANDVLKLGWYRVDIPRQSPVNVASIGDGLYMWIPIRGHKGIDKNYPVVISDRLDKVWFLPVNFVQRNISSLIQSLDVAMSNDCLTAKQIPFTWLVPERPPLLEARRFDTNENNELVDVSYECTLYTMESTASRPSISRFLNLEEYTIPTHQWLGSLARPQTTWMENLGIYQVLDDQWVVVGKEGLIEHTLSSDPRMIDGGEMCHGWAFEGDGLVWRSTFDGINTNIYAIKEIPSSRISDVHDVQNDNDEEYIAHEITISEYQWKVMTSQDRHAMMDKNLKKKLTKHF